MNEDPIFYTNKINFQCSDMKQKCCPVFPPIIETVNVTLRDHPLIEWHVWFTVVHYSGRRLYQYNEDDFRIKVWLKLSC